VIQPCLSELLVLSKDYLKTATDTGRGEFIQTKNPLPATGRGFFVELKCFI
jgi:hypothetical protein